MTRNFGLRPKLYTISAFQAFEILLLDIQAKKTAIILTEVISQHPLFLSGLKGRYTKNQERTALGFLTNKSGNTESAI